MAASHKVPNTQTNRPETTHGPRTACCYRQICYPAEFPIFALKFFKPIFLRENTLTFEIKSNELEAGHYNFAPEVSEFIFNGHKGKNVKIKIQR